MDESGFEPAVTRRCAYARKEVRVYGLTSGHRRPHLAAGRPDRQPFCRLDLV